jgi:hypothetical protein
MSWNTKQPSLSAIPEQRGGRKVYRVTNSGGLPATHIRATLRVGGEDRSELLQLGQMPEELPAGASFLLGLTAAFRDAGVLTLEWQGPSGGEQRWHGGVFR